MNVYIPAWLEPVKSGPYVLVHAIYDKKGRKWQIQKLYAECGKALFISFQTKYITSWYLLYTLHSVHFVT